MDEVVLDKEELLEVENKNSLGQECMQMDRCSFLMILFLILIAFIFVIIILWALIHFV